MREPEEILYNAILHICDDRHHTRFALDIFRADPADYDAIRILQSVYNLVKTIGNYPTRTPHYPHTREFIS